MKNFDPLKLVQIKKRLNEYKLLDPNIINQDLHILREIFQDTFESVGEDYNKWAKTNSSMCLFKALR